MILEGQAGKINWHLSGYHNKTDDLLIPGYAESQYLREAEFISSEDVAEEEDQEELPS